MTNTVHLHDCSGQNYQRLEAHQLEHLGFVVLLALEEPPLELEGVAVDGADLLQLGQDGLDLLGSDREQRIVSHLEAVDLGRRAVERDLHDDLQIEPIIKLDEDFRPREGSQLQVFLHVDFADVLEAAEEGGGGRDVQVVVFLVVFDVGDIVSALLGVDGDGHLGRRVGLDVVAEEVDLIREEGEQETLGYLHLSFLLLHLSEFFHNEWRQLLLFPLVFLCLLGQQGPVHCDGILNVSVVDVEWILC